MRPLHSLSVALMAVFAFLSLVPARASAQANNARPRISQAVEEARTTVLRGNTHPFARPEFDRGAVPGDLSMERMLLVLKRSPEQEAALGRLMAEQQDKSSPNFHKWLTPVQFGQEFGPSDLDIQTITRWLESHGFQVAPVSNGRTVIEFSGTAAQVQEAFHTPVHQFVVNGESHWANVSDPSIPTALAPVVTGVNALHSFPLRPMGHVVGTFFRSSSKSPVAQADPLFTFTSGSPCGEAENLGVTPGGNQCFAVGPSDFATIYNLMSLWNAATPIDGTGETIAIANASNINLQDVRTFRSLFGLPAKDPIVVVNGTNPGIQKSGDEAEALIDTEWSGAVAKNATILLVISSGNSPVDLSAQFIVDNNLAPILSMSFGECEADLGAGGNQHFNSLWQQAAAEGITVLVSSGDDGSAGCDFQSVPASRGLQVNGIASTPFNVAVGGTDFDDLTNPATFWSSANNGTTELSALGYIPESTWNDTCTNALFLNHGFGGTVASVCNSTQLKSENGNNFVQPLGGAGGPSGVYAKPSWQQGGVTPADLARDLPDVSLFGATGAISASFYFICESDIAACTTTGQIVGAGGTSVSAQAFAGIMALVNQKAGERQGNANAVLYALAAKSGATCPSAANPLPSCIFYDVTAGTIAMPCANNTPNCNASNPVGVLTGFDAATGYDLATGLGSINAANLVSATDQTTTGGWATSSSNVDFKLSSSNPVVTTSNGTGTFSITIAAQNGFNASVTLSCIAMPGTDVCSNFNPSSPVMISGSTPIIVTVKGSAAGVFRLPNKPARWNLRTPIQGVFIACVLFSVFLLFGLRGRQRRWTMTFALMVLSLGIAAAGCSSGAGGGGGGGGVAATPGTGVLVATSGGVTHSMAFTIQ